MTPAIEPFYATMALFDVRLKKKVRKKKNLIIFVLADVTQQKNKLLHTEHCSV